MSPTPDDVTGGDVLLSTRVSRDSLSSSGGGVCLYDATVVASVYTPNYGGVTHCSSDGEMNSVYLEAWLTILPCDWMEFRANQILRKTGPNSV
ncbi:hypothetical protein FKM82_019133 [Ascaphus truei]